MISLDSPAWAKLHHAYGSASDIPVLLKQLEHHPKSGGNAEPWFSLWSALAHQGDVYSASFAAVPHVIRALAIDPAKASSDYFAFPAWVEICRQRQKLAVPDDLSGDYFQAIRDLAGLVSPSAMRDWDINMLRAAMAALAVSKGFAVVAEAAQELDDQTPESFLKLQNLR